MKSSETVKKVPLFLFLLVSTILVAPAFVAPARAQS